MRGTLREVIHMERHARILNVAGYVLAISYPLLAFSAAGRSVYQLFFKDELIAGIGPYTSLFASACYLTATVGMSYRRPITWYISLYALGLESVATLVVGTLSLVNPALVGSSVWRAFGIDFAFFPLIQPFLGIAWLLWPNTKALFGFQVQPDQR